MLNTMLRQIGCRVRCKNIRTTKQLITILIKGHEVKDTSNLLTQFGATSPTSRGYKAKNEIHYSSINSKHT